MNKKIKDIIIDLSIFIKSLRLEWYVDMKFYDFAIFIFL